MSFLTECLHAGDIAYSSCCSARRTSWIADPPKNTSVIVKCWSRTHPPGVFQGPRHRAVRFRAETNIQRVHFAHCSALGRKNIICRDWKSSSLRDFKRSGDEEEKNTCCQRDSRCRRGGFQRVVASSCAEYVGAVLRPPRSVG